jgi:hypothetical protein
MATKKPRKKVSGDPRERLFRKIKSSIVAKNLKVQAHNDAEIARFEREVEDGILILAAAQKEVDRLNNLPLGDPEHGERLMLTYDPILAWLDSVETTGDMDTTPNGVAFIHTPDHPTGDQYFQLDSALIAISDVFELISNDRGIPNESKGLRQVGKKVEAGMMLFESDIAAARKSIAWMVEITKTLTPLGILEYTDTIKTKALIEIALQDQRRAA